MRDATDENTYAFLNSLNQQWTKTMNPLQVIRNEFFHNLRTDHIAVDASGTPIARSTDRQGVEQAAPNAAAYFSAADFPDLVNTQALSAPIKTPLPEPVKVMPSAGLADTPKPVYEAPKTQQSERPAGLPAYDQFKNNPVGRFNNEPQAGSQTSTATQNPQANGANLRSNGPDVDDHTDTAN